MQYDIKWREKSTNFDIIRKMLAAESEIDLILLPEMFQTGFAVKEPEEAEGMDGISVTFMRTLAREKNAVVAGSLMIEHDGKLFNRFVVTDASAVLASYDKQHLFELSAEGENFTAGKEKVDVTIKGWKCRLITCYDLRFPYAAYNDSDYDALLIGANWPVQRIRHWDRLLQARAIENQAYVAAANRVGVDPFEVQYPGHSSAYGPNGDRLIRFAGEQVEYVILKAAHLKESREKLPFLKDRRV